MVREQIKQRVISLANESNHDELLWISGYLAGIAAGHKAELKIGVTTEVPVAAKSSVDTISIFYGTETGNAKKVALKAATHFKQKGIRVKLQDVSLYNPEKLNQEDHFLVIISTQGDGEPPVSAKAFYEFLQSGKLKLEGKRFAVLALGSTAYPLFCQTGIEVDEWLEKAGGKRIVPVVKCDEDFDADADKWMNAILPALGATATTPKATPAKSDDAAKPASKQKQTAIATVSQNILLNDEGSSRQTHHIELTLQGEFDYVPGDAVGIVPHNRQQVVQQVIALSTLKPQQSIKYREESYALETLLQNKLNLVHLSLRYIKKYAELTGHDIPQTRMDFYDLLRIYPVKDAAQFEQAINLLDPMAPRLYTLASAPDAHPGELHLTVLRQPIVEHHELVYGLCSDYLSLLQPGAVVNVFLHKHKHFQLPSDSQDIIMIGPGTGIAPFRSFLAQRDATAAAGKNWLFFGEPDFTTDFYYQTELQAWHETGVLQKVDLAWSDGIEKDKHVHELLLRKGEELWQWISNGAGVYVSGEKEPMSKQVDEALVQVFKQYGNHDETSAAALLKTLSKEGRYAKDVY